MGKRVVESGFVSKAVLTNFRVSPRKARLVANIIRGRKVNTALEVLSYAEKKTAPALKKLLLSAVANAKDRAGVDVDELFVRSVMVNEGRKFKRFLPRARGSATRLIKRHSTITIVLDEVGVRR